MKVQELAERASEEAQSTSANEEISSSSQALAELAEQLQKDMSHFTV